MSLEIKKLTKSFNGRKVLDQISFNVAKSQIVFVLGTSGTGKSVLLKNIVGLLRPDSGEIWLEGQEISQLDDDKLFSVRKKCGMIFQHPALFDSLTVLENVATGLRVHFPALTEEEIRSRVKYYLGLVKLEGIEARMPSEISYGMQKRVSIARTLACEPEYLLFDEPTTGLDPLTAKAINDLTSELSRTLNVSSLVVSHDMECAIDIADKIIVLDKGKIVGEGTPQELNLSEVTLVKEFLSEAFQTAGVLRR